MNAPSSDSSSVGKEKANSASTQKNKMFGKTASQSQQTGSSGHPKFALMRQIFQCKRISTIKRFKHYIQLQLQQVPLFKKENEPADQQPESETNNDHNRMFRIRSEQLPLLSQKIEALQKHGWEEEFQHWANSMVDHIFMGLLIPPKGDSLKLCSLILSQELLELIGYHIEEAPLEIQKFKSLAIDLIDENTYQVSFTSYLAALQKFIATNLKTQKKVQLNVEETTTNIMYGKLKVTATIKITMPNPFIISYQVIDVIKVIPDLNSQKALEKQKLAMLAEEKTKKFLSKIVQFPQKQKNQEGKIAGYAELKRKKIESKEAADEYDPGCIISTSGPSRKTRRSCQEDGA